MAIGERYDSILKAACDVIARRGFHQASIREIEEAIQNARRYFNAVVRDLNTAIQEFPANLVAGFFQFRPQAYFELDRPEERQVPRVSFGG